MGAKLPEKEWSSAAACASHTGLTVRALRVYEREGLLSPERSANGWRRYGPSDLVRVNTIVILKGFGLTLSQMRGVMRDHSPPVLRMLELQANAWSEKIAGALRALACVDAARRSRCTARAEKAGDDATVITRMAAGPETVHCSDTWNSQSAASSGKYRGEQRSIDGGRLGGNRRGSVQSSGPWWSYERRADEGRSGVASTKRMRFVPLRAVNLI